MPRRGAVNIATTAALTMNMIEQPAIVTINTIKNNDAFFVQFPSVPTYMQHTFTPSIKQKQK